LRSSRSVPGRSLRSTAHLVAPDARCRLAARSRRRGPLGHRPRFRRTLRARDSRGRARPARSRVARDTPRPALLGRASRDAVPLRGRPTPIYRADRLGAEILAAARGWWRRGNLNPDAVRSGIRRTVPPRSPCPTESASTQARRPQPHRRPQAQQRPGSGSADSTFGKSRSSPRPEPGCTASPRPPPAPARDPVRRSHGHRRHQAPGPNVLRMEASGRSPTGVRRFGHVEGRRQRGAPRLVTNVETSHYCLGSTMGPHPYPMIVRDFQRVIGDETAAQLMETKDGCPTWQSPVWEAAPTPSVCSTDSSASRVFGSP